MEPVVTFKSIESTDQNISMWVLWKSETAKNMHISKLSELYSAPDGDSGSVSSNDNGGIDDPNVCEKLHELVLTSTRKKCFSRAPIHTTKEQQKKKKNGKIQFLRL